MFCNYCGAPNPDVASFCNKCGKAVVRSPASAPAQEKGVSNVAPPSPPSVVAADLTASDSRGVASPEKFRTFTGHTLPITSLAFSPNGRLLVSGSRDKTAKLWDVTGGREVRTFTGNLPFTCVEFSPEGRQLVLAACNDAPLDGAKSVTNAITLWDSSSPDEVRNLTGHEGQVYFVKFSPDGRLLASTDGAKAINIWDVTSGQIIRVFRHGWFRTMVLGGTDGSSLTFTPDGRFLASRSWPISLWDLSSGKEARPFGPKSAFGSVSMFIGFTPDGLSLIEASSAGKIRIWDVASGKETRCLTDPPARSGVTYGLRCAALSSDGKFLAAVTYSSAETPREKITLWDIAAGRTLGTVTCGEYFWYQALAFSPDGQWLAIGDCREGGEAFRLLRTSEIR